MLCRTGVPEHKKVAGGTYDNLPSMVKNDAPSRTLPSLPLIFTISRHQLPVPHPNATHNLCHHFIRPVLGFVGRGPNILGLTAAIVAIIISLPSAQPYFVINYGH
jgi:hypothetical protein